MRPYLVTALLAATLLTGGCARKEAAGGQGGRTGPGGPGGDRPVTVSTQLVRLQPFADSLQALGTVSARESVTVTASVSEKVQAVHFDSGQNVRAGAPLVTLSGQTEQASLNEAAAAANEAEQLYRRQSQLAAQQLIARAQLDTQRAARDAARARVAQARAQMADRVIRAPFDGVLGLRRVSPGSLVSPGTVITTLDDISRVHVDFPVPETQLSQVGAGQAVEGMAAAYPGRTFAGTVQTVDARIDPATRALTVRAAFPNIDGALKPGMLLQVRVSRPERLALLVPEIAVVQAGSDSYVYRVTPQGVAERADVKLGTRAGGQVEVLEGLKGGDRIVIDGTGKLRPGQKIKDAGAQGANAAPARPGA